MRVKSKEECEKIFNDFGFYFTSDETWETKDRKNSFGNSIAEHYGEKVNKHAMVESGYGGRSLVFKNGWIQTNLKTKKSDLRLPVEFFNTMEDKLDKILDDD